MHFNLYHNFRCYVSILRLQAIGLLFFPFLGVFVFSKLLLLGLDGLIVRSSSFFGLCVHRLFVFMSCCFNFDISL